MKFAVHAGGAAGFTVGAYDRDATLVIDPFAVQGTGRFGGTGIERVTAMAVDGAGYVYVGGYTDSPQFPGLWTLRGQSGGADAFVVKWDPWQKGAAWVTFLGGQGDDRAMALRADAAGYVYVAGYTDSTAFPVGNAAQALPRGGKDGFLAKLSGGDGSLAFSTYVGGNGDDIVNGLTVAPGGDVWAVGETTSTNLTLSGALQASNGGQRDAFLFRFTSWGALASSTYLGGAGNDRATAAATDAQGDLYVTGCTASPNFPVLGAAFQSLRGAQDAWVAKLSSAGTGLWYSTYLGGSSNSAVLPECGAAIDVDPDGRAWVAGVTNSADFPLQSPLQGSYGGGASDAFVAAVAPQGNALSFSSYWGGAGLEEATALRARAGGGILVGGYTWSSTLPLRDAVQGSAGGLPDGFLLAVRPLGAGYDFSSYLGGAGQEALTALAEWQGGSFFAAGYSDSWNFPNGHTSVGASDAFVVQIGGTPIPPAAAITFASPQPGAYLTLSGVPACQPGTHNLPVTLTMQPGSNCTAHVAVPYVESNTRQAFFRWTDGATANPRTVVIPETPATFTAEFVRQHRVLVSGWPPGSGAVSLQPASGDGFYSENTALAATATGQGIYRFLRWTGKLGHAGNPATFTLAEPSLVSAEFACDTSITPQEVQLVAQSGGKIDFGVAAAPSCTWGAFTNRSWAQVFPLSASGNSNISLTVIPNYGTQTRTATVNFSDRAVSVSQAGSNENPNRRFVRQMYYNFFGRNPLEADVNFQERALLLGTPRADLVMNFFNSAEFGLGGRYVAGLYVGILDRNAEYGGWLWQRNALYAGVKQLELVTNFINSVEFVQKNGTLTNEQFVRLLYRQVLLRTPGQAEVDGHVQSLLTATRGQVAMTFLLSPEFQAGTGPRLTAFLLYACLLMRDPTNEEFDAAVARIGGGASVREMVSEILEGEEFRALLQ
ncbi:MAG: DUF4214 domain-containing protein [Bryobacteraceae bacterium]|nr:DUF4214 domain-containing protein [Bryobacteraceae bacterium]